ncbi:MAG TPA: methylenetetrahydrofolate reductase [NAD(P)H] [Bacteroidales bacterium]|nr:MAG: methylenetetrahydrofolate reductase [NAD(P)H] [Bacteroidetes bacterium GWE2_42_24]HBZ65801.1 methylenetetrahydrofolate reductase [NAD(P)H] [Bacteroidales bacterium]
MHIDEILTTTRKTLFSFEILPPLKGGTFEEIHQSIEPLLEFKPPYINVTYHQEEVVYKHRDGGLLEKKIVRKRPGTVGIASALQYNCRVDVVPHIICGGFTREETENALIDLHFLGIHNVLAVRGDPERSQKEFIAEPDGHTHAVDLVRQIIDLNHGRYLDEELQNSTATNFCVGVAGYPEKHAEAPNQHSDLRHLKEKVDAGANYIVTQLFFDNSKFFDFVDRCRAAGITVPIVPGLKPIAVKSHLIGLPKTFHIEIPDELVHLVEQCKSNREVRQVGVEWAITQTKDLIRAGVPAVHFYTMGNPDNICQIARACF